MSDHRPTKNAPDEARLLQAAARERLSVAAADLALPDPLRLTDWQRATIAGIISKLVRAIEDELRSTLSEAPAVKAHAKLYAAISSAHVDVAGPILERSAAHLDRPLVSALIRRSEEHRRFRARKEGENALLLELIGDADEAVAEQAMAILIAQSRRFDRFSEPVAARTELPAELQHRLVWRVAAALRRYMIEQQELVPADADAAIVGAAERLLAAYDEGDSLEARSMRLARHLHAAGRLSDDLISRALGEGALPLFTSALAVRAGLSFASSWEVLCDPRGRGTVFLLSAAGVERAHSAAILLSLQGSEDAVSARVDLFDVTSPASAAEALRLWQVNPGYREAIAEIAP
jgi:uncharacterized protein (DUF2336 family)